MGINKLKKKLHDSIQKFKKEKFVIVKDEEIAKKFENSSMYYFYKKSMKYLKQYLDEHNNMMPNTMQWGKIAKENECLSTESMKYIGHIEFPEE